MNKILTHEQAAAFVQAVEGTRTNGGVSTRQIYVAYVPSVRSYIVRIVRWHGRLVIDHLKLVATTADFGISVFEVHLDAEDYEVAAKRGFSLDTFEDFADSESHTTLEEFARFYA